MDWVFESPHYKFDRDLFNYFIDFQQKPYYKKIFYSFADKIFLNEISPKYENSFYKDLKSINQFLLNYENRDSLVSIRNKNVESTLQNNTEENKNVGGVMVTKESSLIINSNLNVSVKRVKNTNSLVSPPENCSTDYLSWDFATSEVEAGTSKLPLVDLLQYTCLTKIQRIQILEEYVNVHTIDSLVKASLIPLISFHSKESEKLANFLNSNSQLENFVSFKFKKKVEDLDFNEIGQKNMENGKKLLEVFRNNNLAKIFDFTFIFPTIKNILVKNIKDQNLILEIQKYVLNVLNYLFVEEEHIDLISELYEILIKVKFKKCRVKNEEILQTVAKVARLMELDVYIGQIKAQDEY